MAATKPYLTELLIVNEADPTKYVKIYHDGTNVRVISSSGGIDFDGALIIPDSNFETVTATDGIVASDGGETPKTVTTDHDGTDGTIAVSSGKLLIDADKLVTDETQIFTNTVTNAGATKSVVTTHDDTNGITNITSGTYLIKIAGTTVFTFAAGLLTAAQPIKVPSYDVAGAPDASTAGAGAMAYITNGNAGAATFAVSDGTNWKVVALGSTIAAA